MRAIIPLCCLVAVGCTAKTTTNPVTQTGQLVDTARSTFTVDRAAGVIANGADHATASLQVLDANGLAIAGAQVVLSATGLSATFSAAAVTDANGHTTASLTATGDGGVATLSAKVTSAGLQSVLAAHPTVTFVAPPVIPVIGDGNQPAPPPVIVAVPCDALHPIPRLPGPPWAIAGVGPVEIEARDFDGDGKIDVLSLDAVGNTLSFMAGRGHGTFAMPRSTPTPDTLLAHSPSDMMVLGAVAGDGHSDVVVAGNANLMIFPISASGVLGDPNVAALPAEVNVLRVGDFDHDGRADALLLTQDGNLSVYLAASGFLAAQTALHDRSVAALGDVTNDGNTDVLLMQDSNFQLMTGLGGGAFAAAVPVSSGGLSLQKLEAGDLNGDGKLDLVGVTSDNNQYIVTYVGAGDGNFALTWTGTVASVDVKLVDINKDGHLDVLALLEDELTAGAQIFTGTGDGNLVPSTTLLPPQPHDSAVADVNADGHLDIILGLPLANSFTVAWGGAGPQFPAQVGSVVTTDPNNTGSNSSFDLINAIGYALADYNGDGYLDAVVVDPVNNANELLARFAGQADGTFVSQAATPLPFDRAAAVVAADFNGDGHADLAAFTYDQPSVQILSGQGDFNFIVQSPLTADSSVLMLTTAPLTAHGPPAIIATLDVGFQALVSDSQGGWHLGTPVTAANGTTSALINTPTVGDFDADGFADLVAVPSDTLLVHFFKGSGDGNFLAGTVATDGNTTLSGWPGRGAVADIDQDGHLDVVLPMIQLSGQDPNGFNAFVALHGTGDGNFVPGVPFGQVDFASPRSLSLVDMNADGKLDIITASIVPGSFRVFLNLGGGQFGPSLAYSGGAAVNSSLQVQDFNGDGRPDVLAHGPGGLAMMYHQQCDAFAVVPTVERGASLAGCSAVDPSLIAAAAAAAGLLWARRRRQRS